MSRRFSTNNWLKRKAEIESKIPAHFPEDVKKAILKVYKSVNTGHNHLDRGGKYEGLCYLPCQKNFEAAMEYLGNPVYNYEQQPSVVHGGVTYIIGNPDYENARQRYLNFWVPFCESQGSLPNCDFGDYMC